MASATFALALNDWIEERFTLPYSDLPLTDEADPETAAGAVRSAWGLGEQPIPDMIHLLEAHGVRVFSLLEECAEVDAFSFWRQDVPFVFLNTMKTAERSRMDAAHELGHLVLHRGHGRAPRGRDAELDAQNFGSAFLMPRGSVLASAPRTALLADLHKAKRYWKVSAANLAHRMHRIGLLSDWQYRSIFIELNSLGQRKTEPDGIRRETSLVLQKVLDALRREDHLSKADIAEKLAIPLDELNKIVFGLVLTPMGGGGTGEAREPGPVERPILSIYR
jgi:Zn-dependent peptidase ImmA (M78 family)